MGVDLEHTRDGTGVPPLNFSVKDDIPKDWRPELELPEVDTVITTTEDGYEITHSLSVGDLARISIILSDELITHAVIEELKQRGYTVSRNEENIN